MQKHSAQPVQTDLPVHHVRSTIPTEWARRLAHLAADTGVSKQDLVREGVWHLLRHHNRAEGLCDVVTSTATETEVSP